MKKKRWLIVSLLLVFVIISTVISSRIENYGINTTTGNNEYIYSITPYNEEIVRKLKDISEYKSNFYFRDLLSEKFSTVCVYGPYDPNLANENVIWHDEEAYWTLSYIGDAKTEVFLRIPRSEFDLPIGSVCAGEFAIGAFRDVNGKTQLTIRDP